MQELLQNMPLMGLIFGKKCLFLKKIWNNPCHFVLFV